MRWIQERQKQRFTDKFIDEFVSKCKKETGGDNFVVPYGGGWWDFRTNKKRDTWWWFCTQTLDDTALNKESLWS